MEKFKFYLLIPSVYGKSNAGTLIRSASAFNCSSIFILNQDKKILKKFFGSQGTVKKMFFKYFSSLQELYDYCKQNTISICGVNIKYKNTKTDAQPIQHFQPQANTLFILGNSFNDIPDELESICDTFTYVEQHSEIAGELNISIIGSIVFHTFGVVAGYDEAGLNEHFNKEKYIVETATTTTAVTALTSHNEVNK